MRFDPLEIIHDTFRHAARFIFESGRNPLEGVTALFLIVACWTCGDDVIASVSTTSANRNEMLLNECGPSVPQTRRSLTIGARPVEIGKCSIPVVRCKTDRHLLLEIVSSRPSLTRLIRMAFIPLLRQLALLLKIAQTPFAASIALPLWMLYSMVAAVFAYLFGMSHAPLLALFIELLSVVPIVLFAALIIAFSARGHQAILPHLLVRKVFKSGRKKLIAHSTTFIGQRLINHLRNSLAGLAEQWGVGKTAKQVLSAGHDSCLSLSHLNCTARWSAAL